MNLGAILEVAIGIIFVWITLSLATIQIQEWITTWLDKRAKDMESAIHEMLANPNLKSQFYDHPVIRALTAKKRKRPSIIPPQFYNFPIVRGITKEKREIPSYIPAQQFALTLFDIAMTAGTESSLIQQGIFKIRDDLESIKTESQDQEVIEALNVLADLARSAAATEAGTAITNYTLDTLTKEVHALAQRYSKSESDRIRSVGQALVRALREARLIQNEVVQTASKQKPASGESALSQLRSGIAALSVISPELNQTLSALLLQVEDYTTDKETQLAKARENVEKWFDDSMDRVAGTFKRYSQWLALMLGMIVALLVNVDSINLTLYLWRDSSVRQVLVEKAAEFELPSEQLAANPEQAMQEFRSKFVGLNLPIGWVINESGGPAIMDSQCQLFPGTEQAFGIPVFTSKKCIAPPQSNNQTNIALKLIGILLTAGATAQGAPFWFDILKKLVNLRGTGANPVEKEASK